MTYIVEQKIKGHIYLYEVTSFWDKNKKQPRQKRKYLGPKEKIYKKTPPPNKQRYQKKPADFTSKSYGDVFLFEYLSKELGLSAILEKVFDKDYKEILHLSYYMLSESSPSYLFPYWHEAHDISPVKKLNSQQLSALYDFIGRHERARLNCMKAWIQHVNPASGIYYDITSISSYSTNIPEVEWGYNRDKESLPQINLGITYCSERALPLSYSVRPGSITDVTTLENTIKWFDMFGLKEMFFILDRGFFSIANILKMRNKNRRFIQPLTLSLKKTKALIKKHSPHIRSAENAFKYKEAILYHLSDRVEFEGTQFDAHVFYNEKAAIDYKHALYSSLLEIDEQLGDLKPFSKEAAFKKYMGDNFPKKYIKYFKFDEAAQKIVRNVKTIEESLRSAGFFIFLVDGEAMTKERVLDMYRNRDAIEKVFDRMKNRMDGNRIRAHNQYTADGRLFIKFISLIIYSSLINVVKKDKQLSKYSINEIIAELKKLKINTFDKRHVFLSELSKKQKIIFKAFNIDPTTIIV